MEAAGEFAQVVERKGKLVAGVHERRAHGRWIGIELRQRKPQRQRENDEVLLRAVVEIALEATPLEVTGSDNPSSRRGELLEPGVELGVQPMDLRLLRLAFGDVGVGDHVAENLAGMRL